METIIVEELRRIEADNDVRILWAIESGSRSWGFASPDSDYDVRFIYVNRPQWYLSIEEPRDVIELPIDDELDISGWDMRKALRLFKKSNPVLLEWLVSPIVYKRSGCFREKLLAVAPEIFSRKSCAYHYLRMAENNYSRSVANRDPVRLKKYFYVLRPLLNVEWLEVKDCIPPMSFVETVRMLDLPQGVKDCIFELLDKKKVTSEMGTGLRIPVLDDFIVTQLEKARAYCQTASVGIVGNEQLDSLFRQIVSENWN